ncbi:MAG: 30S ribosomal protein S6e [Thermoplasmata archaeon]|jgi:small subunit ribosomal protein S6e|nr:30S ribosomal protein S6e [Thermoplasmata archaeon]MVT13223.1 30S ribosomal protein S6e [Euryarchaeota archaeon]MVT14704.1 30S ribosomal protein S6e [Euryarchaeota archaeon]MVT35944.1 30S ribosomal protein S6e [Euryarchaeota archaeon]
MATFRIVVSDPKSGKSLQREISERPADSLIGKKIGDTIEGSLIGFDGYRLKITGGTDKDGFPMSPSIPGGVRKAVLLSSGFGFHPKRKGMRKKKILRGNTITSEIVQINTVIVEYGEKPIFEEKKDEGTA